MRWRYLVVFYCFIALFLCIWIKLFFWQFVRAEELSALGRQQYSLQLEIPPKRGKIETSDGFPLVTNKIAYLVYANPKEIKDQGKIIELLSSLLHADKASVSSELSLDKLWVPIQANVSEEVKEKVDSLHLPGIGFEETPTRFYPEASLAAQLIGFVGKNEFGEDKGYFGLEGYYDMQLRGRVGKTTILHDAFGRPIFAKLSENSGQQDGRNVKLHIDRVIQFIAERNLQEGIEKYGASSGMVGIMDPKSGSILAMSSFPSFDPASYWQYDQSLYKNSFITDTYEPGSTFKPLVMSAALDLGLITPTTKCTICYGPVKVGDYDIHTWNDKYYPNTTMLDVMQHSDNTGMVFVSEKLGLTNMLESLQKFGIWQTTGIDMQGEFTPDIRPRNQWYPIDVATTSFGQGISVTPIQLLDGFCSIGNNGERMEPHIVDTIETPEGRTIPIPPKIVDQPISAKTAKVMTEILVNAVNKGEANFARLPGYRVAGKTGTASIPVNGHYDTTKTIASFIGFAPADNPKFCMLVIFNKPTTSIYGAETAAPVFFDIAKDVFSYYGISPTGE